MKRRTTEFKQALVKKYGLSSLSLRSFSKSEGISISTMYSWNSKYGTVRETDEAGSINPEKWSPEEKFSIVLQTVGLSAAELGEYCRGKGLYPEQVKVWKASCVQGNMTNNDQKKQVESDARADKKRIKELERELRRKDKALAEAAALLVLRKKLTALWEDEEDA
jgi:transposase-like protein